MPEFYVKVGDKVSFAKTVGETDIYLFAGITGDFSVNHVNEQYMARSKFGKRIAHGALIVGYMSTCSTMMIEQCRGTARGETRTFLGKQQRARPADAGTAAGDDADLALEPHIWNLRRP